MRYWRDHKKPNIQGSTNSFIKIYKLNNNFYLPMHLLLHLRNLLTI